MLPHRLNKGRSKIDFEQAYIWSKHKQPLGNLCINISPLPTSPAQFTNLTEWFSNLRPWRTNLRVKFAMNFLYSKLSLPQTTSYPSHVLLYFLNYRHKLLLRFWICRALRTATRKISFPAPILAGIFITQARLWDSSRLSLAWSVF